MNQQQIIKELALMDHPAAQRGIGLIRQGLPVEEVLMAVLKSMVSVNAHLQGKVIEHEMKRPPAPIVVYLTGTTEDYPLLKKLQNAMKE